MMKESIRVALIQPKPYPSFEDPKNLGHAYQLVERLRGEKIDVICFPECFPFQGEEALADIARQHQAYVIAGLAELEGNHLYNTATLFDRQGNLLGRQRKRNLGVLERQNLNMTEGDGIHRAFSTDFGKIGLAVCIDFWGNPEGARQLAAQGVEIVFNICVFPVLRGHWITGSLARAFDHFLCVVGVNTADYNALFGGRRVHHHGGDSFVIQPPRMLDKEDFRRWIRSLDNVEHWVTERLGELEQVHTAEVNLGVVRRFRDEFKNRFGFRR